MLFLLQTAEPVHADEEGADGAASSLISTTSWPFSCKHACSPLHVLCPSRSATAAVQRKDPLGPVWSVSKTLEQPVEAAAGYNLCFLLHQQQVGKHCVSRPCPEPVFSSFLFFRCFLFLFRCFSLHTSLLSRLMLHCPFASFRTEDKNLSKCSEDISAKLSYFRIVTSQVLRPNSI